MRLIRIATIVMLPLLAGCVGEDPFDTGQRPASPEAGDVSTDTVETAAQPAAEQTEPSEPKLQPTASPPVRKKAAPGVTGKGNYGGGMITTPISVYFRTGERITFNIEIPHALKLYKASNDRSPRSHEEFMTEIIGANNIRLPNLPAGDRYLYDPEKEELFVVQQK